MGVQSMWNDDLHEYRDTVRGLSDADRRELDRVIAKDDQHWANLMQERYADTVNLLTDRLGSVLRVCARGEENIDADIEAYRNGELTDEEFGNRLTEYSADLNRLRPFVESAGESEARAWGEVNVTPGEFQRATAKRFPALFSGGRGLVRVQTPDE
ncbi:hypothetical protein [Nocardioides antri]|uniref:Uncharacterized protein n=1 Tax=Nocardioides antri TaxID=2607659 RepID=A0A5B1LSV8_9ACTN|nr:hypothetical protein [Nocardioides antri]KAA1423188.1 hypothetical protein F0U47_20135 [Nocardioides antri]